MKKKIPSILLFFLVLSIGLNGEPEVQAVPDIVHTPVDGPKYDLSALTKEKYFEWMGEMIVFSKRTPELFRREAKITIVTMLGLEDKPEVAKVLDLSVEWNKYMLFSVVALGNEIKISDDALMRLFNETKKLSESVPDEKKKAYISLLYNTTIDENENTP